MTQKIFTIPIVAHTGFAARADGRPAVALETDEFANASVIVPRSGTANIGIVFTSKVPKQGINLFVGYIMGRGNLPQEWGPPTGNVTVNLNETHTVERERVASNVELTEGDLLGIRIINKEPGFRLGLVGVYMRFLD
jgi:hypothetical protein